VIFLFLAEDSIRDRNVTGVQTCALQIFHYIRGMENMVYINGEWRNANKTIDVINPATGETIDSVATCGKAETEEAIKHAATAFKTWKNTPGPTRGNYLAKAVALMREQAEEFAEIVTKENGN